MLYRFVTVATDDANATLDRYANAGWTVHSINRNAGASIVDILFEQPIR